MALITSFNFEVDAVLILDNGKEYDIPTESIQYVVTEYLYDVNNMPIIMVGININSNLYDIMVENMETATITFSIYKYDTSSTTFLRKKYISDRFIYLMDTNPNYRKSLEIKASDKNENTTGKDYKQGNLALLKMDLINENKIIMNDIIKDSNIASIIHRYTKHMNMIIEPFEDNKIIDQIIIPPIESVTNLLDYLDRTVCIYKGGYRYFRDFYKTYLLSNRGNPVHDRTDMNYDTLIIRVHDTSDDDSKLHSVEIDKNNKVYILNIDSNNTSIEINKIKDKSYNSIIGIDTMGNMKKLQLNIPINKESKEKITLHRIFNDNMESLQSLKTIMDDSSILLNISKSEIDSTLLTPNREYLVQNYSSYKQYDGRFLLSYKKEVLIQQDGRFISSAMFGLRKMME